MATGADFEIDTGFININMTRNKIYLIFIEPDYPGSACAFYILYNAYEKKLMEVHRFQCSVSFSSSTNKITVHNSGNAQSFKIKIYCLL